MTCTDARSLSREAQAERHRLALQLFQRGMPSKEIAEVVSVHYGTVRQWVANFKKDGNDKIVASDFYGTHNTKITEKDAFWLGIVIRSSTPSDHGFDSHLWTLALMQSLLRSRRALSVGISTICRTMHKYRLSPRVPTKQPQEKDQEEIQYLSQTNLERSRSRSRHRR